MKFNFGNYIKQLRTGRGWTQVDLAERMNCSKQYISQIEGSKRLPNLENLEKFAEAFELQLNPDLFIQK